MKGEEEQEELTKLRQLNKSQIIEVQHVVEDENKKCCKNHGNKKSKKGGKSPGVIIYCVFTCLSCLYLQTTQFYPLMKDQSSSSIYTKLSYFVVFMCMWSYYKTIVTSSAVVKLQGAPHVDIKKQIDSNYLKKQCEHCQYYKPPRVSHCSTCGTCIYKLDHHCMWTQNCIGYRNQRSFYLFCLYMTLGLLQYWHATFKTFGQIYQTCHFFSYFEPGVYILWLITCFSALFVGIMIVALCISHTMMILTNFTTLTGMKTKKMCALPFCECRDMILAPDNVNLYDRGEIQNIRSLFGTNILTCWMPLTREIENEFIFEKMHPHPTERQISSLTGNISEEIERQKQVERLLPKIKEHYKGKKVIIEGEEIEL